MAEKNPPARKSALTRRQFAGAVAAGLAAPALLGGALAQEEEKPAQARAQGQGPGQGEEETWLRRGRQALREHPVPVETEPAFVFSARVGGGHGE